MIKSCNNCIHKGKPMHLFICKGCLHMKRPDMWEAKEDDAKM